MTRRDLAKYLLGGVGAAAVAVVPSLNDDKTDKPLHIMTFYYEDGNKNSQDEAIQRADAWGKEIVRCGRDIRDYGFMILPLTHKV